jgi:hypothetical protein
MDSIISVLQSIRAAFYKLGNKAGWSRHRSEQTFEMASVVVDLARTGSVSLTLLKERVDSALADGWTYRELGTSTKELAQFPRIKALACGRIAVEHGRLGVGDANANLSAINEALDFGWTYADMDTTRAETEEFPRTRAILHARYVLETLRDGEDLEFDLDVEAAVRAARSFGCSYEDLGTSQEEVSRFVRLRLLEVARIATHDYRQNRASPDELAQAAQSALAAGWTAADMGLTPHEVVLIQP